MADETTTEQGAEEIKTPVEGQIAAPEQSVEQEKPEGEAESKLEVKAEAPAEEKLKQTPWFQRRIDELTREKWEERRAREAAEGKLREVVGAAQQSETAPEGTEQPKPTARTFTEADVRREATRLAGQEAARIAFDTRCNEVYTTGKDQFTDFDERLAAFKPLGGLPTGFIAAALETGDPAKVLYELGGNLDEAARILSLPPLKQVAELTKMAHGLGRAKPVSSAPNPIKSKVGGSPKSGTDLDDNLSTEEWMKRRAKQLKEKRA